MEIKEILEKLEKGDDVAVSTLRQILHNIERTLLAQKNPGYNICFDRLIGHEGGYVNDPNDPGGETNWGVSKRSYPDLDIKSLTREDAREIYKRDFWDKVNADRLPFSVVYQLFDFAVNSGPETAVRTLQSIVGAAPDGHWGPISQSLCDAKSEADLLLNLNSKRLFFMTSLNAWKFYNKGWAKRIAQNLAYAAEDNVS